jgi:hypothetical protein
MPGEGVSQPWVGTNALLLHCVATFYDEPAAFKWACVSDYNKDSSSGAVAACGCRGGY